MKKYIVSIAMAGTLALTGCAGAAVSAPSPTPKPLFTASTGEVITLDDAGIVDLVKQRYAGCLTVFVPTSDLQYVRKGSDLLPGTLYWYNDTSDLVFDVAQGNSPDTILTVPDGFSFTQIDNAGC